jgi:hypothetical protein
MIVTDKDGRLGFVSMRNQRANDMPGACGVARLASDFELDIDQRHELGVTTVGVSHDLRTVFTVCVSA